MPRKKTAAKLPSTLAEWLEVSRQPAAVFVAESLLDLNNRASQMGGIESWMPDVYSPAMDAAIKEAEEAHPVKGQGHLEPGPIMAAALDAGVGFGIAVGLRLRNL